MAQRHCCEQTCKKPAEYQIITVRDGGMAGPDPYSDYTDACTDHVGALLGYQPDAVRPEEIYWHVHWLGEPASPTPRNEQEA